MEPSASLAAPLAAAPVSPIAVAACVDHSVYGEAAETFLRFRLKWKQWRKEKRWRPVVGEDEAKAIADDYTLPEADVESIKEKMVQIAQKRGWKELPPELSLAMLYANIEFHWFVQERREEERLKKLEAAMAEQKKLSRMGVTAAAAESTSFAPGFEPGIPIAKG